jgi:hypothetical protein
MSGLTSPYYNPEELGLEIIHSIEDSDVSGYDMLLVWRRTSDNALFWAQDSGGQDCTPFEDCHDEEDLEPLTAETFPEFVQVAASQVGASTSFVDEALQDIQRRLGGA